MATLREVRVGQDVEDLHLVVLEVWEGGAYLVGDETASLRMVVPAGVRPFSQFEYIVVDVHVQKSNLRFLAEKTPPKKSVSSMLVLESCGVIAQAKDTHQFLLIRDYHTKPFIDVQFKLRAAFEQKILKLPLDAMIRNISQWSDEEVKWIVEWKLTGIWPYVKPETIKAWDPIMRKMGDDIKQLYRACKAELERRNSSEHHVSNTSWGFPKGGCKLVRSRVETPEDVAIRELIEETGLTATPADFLRHFDIPRAHGKTFDRWFVMELSSAKPISPPPGAWDVARIEWTSLKDFPPSMDHFKEYLGELLPPDMRPASHTVSRAQDEEW